MTNVLLLFKSLIAGSVITSAYYLFQVARMGAKTALDRHRIKRNWHVYYAKSFYKIIWVAIFLIEGMVHTMSLVFDYHPAAARDEMFTIHLVVAISFIVLLTAQRIPFFLAPKKVGKLHYVTGSICIALFLALLYLGGTLLYKF